MSRIRHSVHVMSKQLAYLLVIIATLSMLLIGALYWLSNAIEQRQDEIAAWVSKTVGYPVEIGSAGLYMFDLIPKLEVNSITVFTQAQTAELLNLEHLYIGLDLMSSIQQGELVFNDITLMGLNISIVRNNDGRFQLQGLSEQPPPSLVIEDLLTWARLLNRVHLQAVTVDYIDQINNLLSGRYQLVDVIVSQQGDRWVTTGSTQFPSTLADSVQFNAEVEIDNNDISSSLWLFQTKINSLVLAAVNEHLVWHDIALDQGILNANISSSGVGSHVDLVTAEVDLSESELVSKQVSNIYTPVSIEHLIGEFEWQQQDQSWQLSARNLQLSVNNDYWPQTDFLVSKSPDGIWSASGQYLRLSDLTAVALLSTSFPEIIRQQQPAGDVERFSVHYSQDGGLMDLEFNLHDGVLLPWKNFPGVTGLTTYLSWRDGLGSLNLDSHQITIYPEAWLDDAIFFDSATGVLRLQRDQQTWSLQSQELRVWNDDLTLQLDGDVEKTSDGKIFNNLKLTMEEVAVNRWQSYIPQQLLKKEFKAWANNAFLAGTIVDGEIELQGEMSAFPYKKSPEKGSFNVTLNVEGVDLHYAPRWPDLFGIRGVITGNANEFIIRSQQGTVSDADFIDVTAIVSDIGTSKLAVSIDGKVKGTLAQGIAFLQSSPLQENIVINTEKIVAKGKNNIHLKLKIPLANLPATQVSGTVDLIDAQIYSVLLPEIKISQINGPLKFNKHGVSADDIKALLFEEQVNIAIKQKEGGNTLVIVGEVDSKQLGTIWNDRVLDSVNGKTAYQLELMALENKSGARQMNIFVQSDLTGFNIDLPKPFGKHQQEKKTLSFRTEFRSDGPVYSFMYGELNAVIKAEQPVWRAGLRFGTGSAVQLPEQGVRVRGKLTELSIDNWLEWYEKQTQDASGLSSSINDVSITIEQLTGFNQNLTSLDISAQKDKQDWQVKIDSDQSKGVITWPVEFNDSSKLKVVLDKLELSLPDVDGEKEKPQTNLWPAVDIAIGSLALNQIPLGELHVIANRTESSWTVDLATLDSEVFTALVPVGEWKRTTAGDQSHFQLDLTIHDVDTFLTNLGYQEAIDAEIAEYSVDLSWPDQPIAVNYGTINGTANIDIGKGKVKKVEPGAAGRILGLLSITAIPRRLSLDFSDLFSKGFSFRSIKGSFQVADGKAITNDLVMKGPTATIEVTGLADLVNQQYDQLVKVRPNIAATLPIAGAVAAGPIGLGLGAVVMIADKVVGKIFGKGIDKLISYDYQLTGPWDDPHLNAIKSKAQ